MEGSCSRYVGGLLLSVPATTAGRRASRRLNQFGAGALCSCIQYLNRNLAEQVDLSLRSSLSSARASSPLPVASRDSSQIADGIADEPEPGNGSRSSPP